MTPEWVAAIAAVATFIVISATAIAALVQLRHMRNGNQIAIFSDIRHKVETPEFRQALQFIVRELPQRLDDPAFRARLFDPESEERRQVLDVGNYLDGAVAPLVKHRMVDRDLACDLLYFYVVRFWDSVAPFIATARAEVGYRMWEDLEYLALLCKRFRKRFPSGTYPKGAPALPLPEPWPERQQRGSGAKNLGNASSKLQHQPDSSG